MKKFLKSRLCVFAMGTIFYANSNAVTWLKLSENVLLMDQNNKLKFGTPTSPGVMADNITSFAQGVFEGGSEFKVYFLNAPILQGVPSINLFMLDSSLSEPITEILNNQEGAVGNITNKLMMANMLAMKRNKHLEAIKTYKQNLANKAEDFNSKINADSNIKTSLIITLNEGDLVNGKLEIEGIELVNVDQDPSDVQLKFSVPEKTKDMDNEDYYQYLKKVNQQWSDLYNGLTRAFPNVFSQGSSQ